MTNRDHSPSISQNDGGDAKSSGEGSGHTPERWELRPCLDPTGTRVSSLDICLPSRPEDVGVGVLASVWGNEGTACLMAVAPELLELLEEGLTSAWCDAVIGCLPHVEAHRAARFRRLFYDWQRRARAAIAKASPPPSAEPGEGGSIQTLEDRQTLESGDQ